MQTRKFLRPAVAGLALAVVGLAAQPTVAADYYAGKTIDLLIGADPAGGYDTYARVIARHMPGHIPGTPTFIPRNLPGAGSGRAAAFIYSVAPKDGSSFAAIMPGAVMAPLTDSAVAAQFDSTKFEYLGSADAGTRVCATFHTSQTKTLADAMNRETIIGASADGGATKDYPTVLNAVAGTKFKMITGYKGTNEILLAVERGEVEGLCGFDWSSLKSGRGQWLAEKKLNIMVQLAIDAEPELTALAVPPIWNFLKTEDDRKIVEMLVSEQLFGRPYILPPGTDPRALKILRDAFDATMKDPEYVADAVKSKLTVNPASGPKVQELVQRLYAAPKSLLARYQDAKGK